MVATAALPFLAGMVLAALSTVAALRAELVALLLWGAAIAVFYLETLGTPVFPPLAASQKLVYLGLAALIIGLLAIVLSQRRIAAIAALVLGVGFAWLSWRRLSAGGLDLAAMTAIAIVILAMAGTLYLVSSRDRDAEPAGPFIGPAAILSIALAGAIVSVLGASIIVGQFLGSIAALVGGYCLILFLIRAGIRPNIAGLPVAVEVLLLFTVLSAVSHSALLAPKVNHVALMLATLSLFAPRLVAGPLRGSVPGNQVFGPLVAGFVVALPAILAIAIAIIWAPEGAALGLS